MLNPHTYERGKEEEEINESDEKEDVQKGRIGDARRDVGR
jgi:hypothetical protein